MRYFDTSFIVPLIFTESTSESIGRFVEGLSSDELAISKWTQVEFYSMLALRHRMGKLSDSEAHESDARFKKLIDGSFDVLPPEHDDFDRAREWLSRFETGLRAGDALHLAIASNRGASVIHSLDKTMIAAGRTLGLPACAGIALPGYGE